MRHARPMALANRFARRLFIKGGPVCARGLMEGLFIARRRGFNGLHLCPSQLCAALMRQGQQHRDSGARWAVTHPRLPAERACRLAHDRQP